MIKIIADTTCGLPIEKLASLDIDVIPQIIIFNNQQFRDDTELDTPTFLSKLTAAKDLPKTAAPPPALYESLFQKYSEKGYSIIIPTPSSEVSGTFRSAEVAAKNVPEADVYIIDTRTIAGGLDVLVKKVKEWIDEGYPVDIILKKLKSLADREVVYFLVDTLTYLHKGGRIGNAAYLVGSMLQMKPILSIEDGKVTAIEKQRTSKKAFNRIIQLVLNQCPTGDGSYITVSHCGGQARAEQIAQELGQRLGLSNIPVYEVPPAIVVHGGPGIISVSFFRAE